MVEGLLRLLTVWHITPRRKKLRNEHMNRFFLFDWGRKEKEREGGRENGEGGRVCLVLLRVSNIPSCFMPLGLRGGVADTPRGQISFAFFFTVTHSVLLSLPPSALDPCSGGFSQPESATDKGLMLRTFAFPHSLLVSLLDFVGILRTRRWRFCWSPIRRHQSFALASDDAPERAAVASGQDCSAEAQQDS